jgi:hypothetical protein
MLEIQERSGSEGYEDIVTAAAGREVHITEALDRGEVIGWIAYVYEPEQTVVLGCDDGGDLLLCDGLVRSVMLKSCMKGISRAVFDLRDESGYAALRRLRFIPQDSNVCEGLDSFMNGCESCKNKERKER